jgi:hypothetical protein
MPLHSIARDMLALLLLVTVAKAAPGFRRALREWTFMFGSSRRARQRWQAIDMLRALESSPPEEGQIPPNDQQTHETVRGLVWRLVESGAQEAEERRRARDTPRSSQTLARVTKRLRRGRE